MVVRIFGGLEYEGKDMKRLFIIRHAKSSWSEKDIDDFDRDLKKRGKDDIKMMACWMKKRGFYPDCILSSPAKRAVKTLNKILKILNVKKQKVIYDKNIYEASLEELLKIISKCKKENNNIFLIGHNPSLNELVEYLTDSVIFNIPTSGIICIEFDVDDWSEIEHKKGSILFFEYPKKLKETKSVKC